MVHPTSTRGSTERESERTKDPEEQRKKKSKNGEKKSSRVRLNHSYRIPTERHTAIPFDHSDMAVRFGR